jgi:hypothetical protein
MKKNQAKRGQQQPAAAAAARQQREGIKEEEDENSMRLFRCCQWERHGKMYGHFQ